MFPFKSVMETIVLLKVARTCATPVLTFLLPFALTIFGFSTSVLSSERLTFAGSASFFVLGFWARGVFAGSDGDGDWAGTGTAVSAPGEVEVEAAGSFLGVSLAILTFQ